MGEKNQIQLKFDIETILDCFISAIGYGVGYSLPNKLGYPPIVCIISCLALGTVFDIISEKILTSKYFVSSKRNMIAFTIGIYVTYFVVCLIVLNTLDYDLDDELLLNIGLLVIFEMLSFAIKYIKELFKQKKE